MPTGGPLVNDERLTFRVPSELSRRVRHEASTRGLTLADLLRELLDRELPMTA